ncbi:MAG: SMP-30/gluconolactonase/LRE family protein [Alphaproteobacteria bacterium]|nr:SMP-30/gluconolactonase/LRE family protein [Alphaproteobacteria bacterium]
MIFDETICSLGEGALWHPIRQSLFWFDINRHRLYEKKLGDETPTMWQFNEFVSAAGWIDENSLLIASETRLFQFHLATQKSDTITLLEADNPLTRSNDGRTDNHGGFWIGTMGKNAEKYSGVIYRYYQGELRRLFANITIANSICFAPDGNIAYFCDTVTHKIMKVRLDADGWVASAPMLHIDLRADNLNPDGSVVDSAGNLWNAQWGASRVACYNQAGDYIDEVKFEATQISCPAFGGADYNLLFATSATQDIDNPDIIYDGITYATPTDYKGQAEHQVKLG